jgi:hypothetical protein
MIQDGCQEEMEAKANSGFLCDDPVRCGGTECDWTSVMAAKLYRMVVSHSAMCRQTLNECGTAIVTRCASTKAREREDRAVLATGRLLRRFLGVFEGDVVEVVGGEQVCHLGVDRLPYSVRVGTSRRFQADL